MASKKADKGVKAKVEPKVEPQFKSEQELRIPCSRLLR